MLTSTEAMSRVMTDEFVVFCRQMWQDCLSERRRHGEEEVTWMEYFENNHDWLVDKYWSQE